MTNPHCDMLGIAFAQTKGATVQWWSVDDSRWYDIRNPLWDVDSFYRVKLEE